MVEVKWTRTKGDRLQKLISEWKPRYVNNLGNVSRSAATDNVICELEHAGEFTQNGHGWGGGCRIRGRWGIRLEEGGGGGNQAVGSRCERLKNWEISVRVERRERELRGRSLWVLLVLSHFCLQTAFRAVEWTGGWTSKKELASLLLSCLPRARLANRGLGGAMWWHWDS